MSLSCSISLCCSISLSVGWRVISGYPNTVPQTTRYRRVRARHGWHFPNIALAAKILLGIIDRIDAEISIWNEMLGDKQFWTTSFSWLWNSLAQLDSKPILMMYLGEATNHFWLFGIPGVFLHVQTYLRSFVQTFMIYHDRSILFYP